MSVRVANRCKHPAIDRRLCGNVSETYQPPFFLCVMMPTRDDELAMQKSIGLSESKPFSMTMRALI